MLSLLRLTFLGTSAAMPTIDRGLSGLALRADGELILFDCGEGSQRQMVRFGTGFDVVSIFFTHFHADHYLGVVGFLRTLGMMGRGAPPVRLYGPPPGRRLLHDALHLGVDELAVPFEIIELAPAQEINGPAYSVRAVAGDHTTPDLGYVFEEAFRPGRFDVDRAQALGVPSGPAFGRLQRGEPVTLADGRVVTPDQVLGPPRRRRRVALSGDTRPTTALAEAARGADLLIHESTFSDDEADRALTTRHSTAREAARVAREAGVDRLILTHLSSRYDRTPGVLLAQAREEFAGAIDVAHDGMVIELAPHV